MALLLTLGGKCEFLPVAYFIPTLSTSLGIYILIIVSCTFQRQGKKECRGKKERLRKGVLGNWGQRWRDGDKEIREEGIGKKGDPRERQGNTDWKAWKRSSVNYDFEYLDQLIGFCFFPFTWIISILNFYLECFTFFRGRSLPPLIFRVQNLMFFKEILLNTDGFANEWKNFFI